MDNQPLSGGPPPGSSLAPSSNRSRARPLLLGGALLALGGLSVWHWTHQEAQAPAAEASAQPALVKPAEPALAEAEAPAVPMAQGDARVRELLGQLSSDAELAKWLGVEGLVQRFATAVSNIAEGDSPRMVLTFMGPAEKFQVARNGEQLLVDPRGYSRYDAVARVVGSLDAQAAASAYTALKPWLERAHAEIARPGQHFDATFGRAIQHLLEVPVASGPMEVLERGAVYAYADERLEGLSRAQKHLLRMGPENAQRIQAKLRELQGALNLPMAHR